ncbi:ankyrin repeat domain-containing protein 31 isoform X2 [Rhinoderma darwinii]|uniref:ankyrin repeat domain-containing protein 31 isoform X2 n=1 Tax=Rhinoderma darwinii TaxID=43563 RepID=UPI003F6695E7
MRTIPEEGGNNSRDIPLEHGEYKLRSMKEGDSPQSKKSHMFLDYDSDETVVGDSIPGSDDEEDELNFKRMFINGDVSPTSTVSLCSKNINIGDQSPEIHYTSKLVPAARTESMETATKEVFDTLSEEEASQSLLRNWERNSESRVTPHKDSYPNQPPMDYTGDQSPEIHYTSKLVPAARTESMETATKEVFDTLSEEEASQSLLRNWERNSESRVTPHKDSYPNQPPMDYTDLCEDAQKLFDSFENEENNSEDESHKTSLLSAIIAIDRSSPEIEMLDHMETVDVQNKDYNVNTTNKDGGANILSEEAQSRNFTDELSIAELLQVSGESDSLTPLSDIIDELSFLEIPEDSNGEMSQVLAAINSMDNPQMQCARDGHAFKGGQPYKQAHSEFSNDHTQTPGSVFADDCGKQKREENGNRLYIEKTYKETAEETIVAKKSNISTPSLLNVFNGVGCIPSDDGHLFNAGENIVTQKSLQPYNEKSTLTKDDCKNVSRNDATCSQTSPPLLRQAKLAGKVSEIATCNGAVKRSRKISSKTIYEMSENEQQLPAVTYEQQVLESIRIDCLPPMSQMNFGKTQQHMELSKSSKSKEAQDDHLSKNTRISKAKTKSLFERTCKDCDRINLFQSAKSSTDLMGRKNKSTTVSHMRKRKSNTSQPQWREKEQQSTESTKAAELVLRKSARLEFHRNAGNISEREKGTDPGNKIRMEETSNYTTPTLFESLHLNRTESVKHCKPSKIFRNIHKRNFMGETLLHKACGKGDLQQVNALIEAGINVHQKDNAGWTAMHEASCKGNSDIILALILAGADVNCKGLDGILPIHDVVYCNHFKAAGILMKFGANPYEKDNNMKNAFDKCCSDKMAEILTSHSGYIPAPTEIVTANVKEPQLMSSPESGTYASRTGDTCSVEILATLHDTESKQKKLLSTELETLEDAEKYIRELNDIQNVLNNIVNLQKIERDTLAKKYRASTDSFKQGILRDKIAKLASSQKTLLQVIRNQKEVTLKIRAHQQTRRSDAINGETSSMLHYCDTSPGRIQISASCAVNEWLEANTANGSTMTTKIPAVDKVPDTERNQSQRTISGCIVSSEISRTAEVPTVSPVSESAAHRNLNLAPRQIPMGLENGSLSFDSCSSMAPVELHDRMNDHLESTAAGSKSYNSAPVSIPLDIMEKRNLFVKKISHQTPHQTTNTDQQLKRPNYENAIQQADDNFFTVLADVSEKWGLQHKALGQTSNILNQTIQQNSKPASEMQQKCVETDRKTRTFPLRKLMKLGKLKAGVDVLSFQLQDYSHKATLLCDGHVTDCSGAVFRDPVQWVKALLGNDISVTWKYVADKVTYCGNKLSRFMGQKDFAPKARAEPDSVEKIAVSPSHQPPGYIKLQVNEILLVDKSDFFPNHLMDQYWEEFMNRDSPDF